MIKIQDIFILPIVLILLILQTSLISRITLVNGSADIMLVTIAAMGLIERNRSIWLWTVIAGLTVSFVSATPFMIPLISYVFLTSTSQYIVKRVRQMPIVAVIFVTIVGTVIFHMFSIIGLNLSGVYIPFIDSVSLIMVPSIILNMLLSVPVYILLSDLISFIYPRTAEE